MLDWHFSDYCNSAENKTILHFDFQINIMIWILLCIASFHFNAHSLYIKFSVILILQKRSSCELTKPLIDYNWWWGMECVALVCVVYLCNYSVGRKLKYKFFSVIRFCASSIMHLTKLFKLHKFKNLHSSWFFAATC